MRRATFCMILIAFAALSGATATSASPGAPAIDFCGGGSAVTRSEISTDPIAGVTWASSLFVPAGAFAPIGVYFNNDGPGPITFAVDWVTGTGAWSTKQGGPIPIGDWTSLATTPTGSVLFSDGGWSGEFPVGLDFLGCVGVGAPPAGLPQTTLHLRLSFTRSGVLFTEPVNVHFR